MPLYEHVFLARQDVSGQQAEALAKEFQGVIEANGGKIAKTEHWGLKPLAYKIKKSRKAHFTLMNIDAPHPAVAEMERQMGISPDVLRYMTLRVDKHESEPSAMMRKGDRDDRRGGRGDRDGGFRGGRDGGFRGERPPRGDRDSGGFRGDRPPRNDGEGGGLRGGPRSSFRAEETEEGGSE
jgi:small subunit ribosomal protein S6